MSKRKHILALAVNAYLFISTLIISLSNLLTTRPPDSHKMGFRGVENLMYFTVDSNILLALCAAGVVIILLRNIKKSPLALPGWFHITFLAAAVSVGVTFATVAFFLSPGQAMLGRGYFSLFTGKNLYLHLINPLLGCADFIWLIPPRRNSAAQKTTGTATENLVGIDEESLVRSVAENLCETSAINCRYSIAECLCGIIPTAIYGAVYTVTVAITKTWPDIYNFTLGGHYELAPIPIVVILALAFGIAVFLTRMYNQFSLRGGI